MATYTGKYAANTSPIIDKFEAGKTVFVEATTSFLVATSAAQIINTGGTYLAIRIPPYARLLDAQMINNILCASTAFYGHLLLLMWNSDTPGGGTAADFVGSLLVGNCAWSTASYTGMRGLRQGAMLYSLNGTNVPGLAYTASNVSSIFGGASSIFNIAATEKYIALCCPTTATLNAGGVPHDLVATPSYLCISAEYRMMNDAALL